MARVSGIDLPKNKRGFVALTYIYGIGRSTALAILTTAGVDPQKKYTNGMTMKQPQFVMLSQAEFKVEGQLRSETQLNIKR
jgi:small subunit ribosomal protein S13